MRDEIGALRARVRLESPGGDEDDVGGAVIVWTDQGAAWAEISACGVTQSAAFDAAPSIARYQVAIRPRDDVRAGWRVTWGGRRFSIIGVADDGGARIALSCEEERL